MADVTYYVALPFLQDDTGAPVAGGGRVPEFVRCVTARGSLVKGRRQRRRGRLQPHRRPDDRRVQRRAIAEKIRRRAG